MRWLTHPVVAAVLFNGAVMIVHIPIARQRVRAGQRDRWLHYGMHVLLVLTALLMWMPVCGPFPSSGSALMGSLIYLFLQSVVPDVPAAWLTFADGVVYKAYDQPVRLWGISADRRPAAGRGDR